MTHILIAESLDEAALATIVEQEGAVLHRCGRNAAPQTLDREHTLHFYYQPDLTVAGIEHTLRDYHGLVVRPKEVTARAISAAPQLQLIVRGGAGVNSIDLEACRLHGVVVENTPGENSVATAEYTMMAMLAMVARRPIVKSDHDTRAGKAEAPELYAGAELAGKSLAVVGLGNIGYKVAARAAAFEMDVCYYSPHKKDAPYPYYSSLEELARTQPDVISLHAPLLPETEGFINDDFYALLKPGTVLINAARPQLMEPNAFENALRSGVLASFVIDGDADLVQPFIAADPQMRGIITHHIADSTAEAQRKITAQVLHQLFAFFREKKVLNQVVG